MNGTKTFEKGLDVADRVCVLGWGLERDIPSSTSGDRASRKLVMWFFDRASVGLELPKQEVLIHHCQSCGYAELTSDQAPGSITEAANAGTHEKVNERTAVGIFILTISRRKVLLWVQ